jgi:hypothetical protein
MIHEFEPLPRRYCETYFRTGSEISTHTQVHAYIETSNSMYIISQSVLTPDMQHWPYTLDAWTIEILICLLAVMLISGHECLTPPTMAPLTSGQLMLSSNSSSTRPTTATLSPRIRYRPCTTSLDGSGSSGGRMILSIVCDSTYVLLDVRLNYIDE